MSLSMQIITFAAIKGGVGKTTLTYNLGEWLVRKKKKKVLLIDADSQSSLSQTYEFYHTKYSLLDIFSYHKVSAEEVIQHTDTVDILPSALNLDQILPQLDTRINKEFVLYIWLDDNYDYLKQYDYIIIDCHPDFSTITQNAIINSDLVISPIEPSQYSLNAKAILTDRFEQLQQDLVDPKAVNGRRQSYVKAELYFIGNRIKFDEESNKSFIKIMKDDPKTIGFVPETELLNESTLFTIPVFAMNDLNGDKLKIANDLGQTFEKLIKLDQSERT